MEKLWNTVLDVVYPPTCAGCGRIGSFICQRCFKEMCLVSESFCGVCGEPSINGFTHLSCLSCFTPERMLSVFVFDGVVKKAVHLAKFEPYAYAYLSFLTSLISGKELKKAFGNKMDFLIVTVPLGSKRLLERGFNQSEIIAKELAKKLGTQVCKNGLRKIKDTAPLSSLGRKARSEAVKDVYWADEKMLRGRDVLLVDDVCTTGATFVSAASALKKVGARFVVCFSLAKAVD